MLTPLDRLARNNDKSTMKAITDEADGGRATLFGALDGSEPKHRQAVLNNFAHITNDALRAEVMQRAEQVFRDVGAPEEDRLAALSGLYKSSHPMLPLYEFGLRDANPKLRFNTLYNIKADKNRGNQRPITPEILGLIVGILRDDPDVVVHDHAVLALAAVEPWRFNDLTANLPVDLIATYRRLSVTPGMAPMMGELNNQVQTAQHITAILDWFESGEMSGFVELNLGSALRSAVFRNKDTHPQLVERYEKYLIGKWLKETHFPPGSTWETAVQAIASGEVDFGDTAYWFAGRGMETRINELFEASINTASTPEAKSKVQSSYSRLMQKLDEMRNR